MNILTSHGPLKGTRILEFAGIGPCPMCGMLLAEMGADVVRIDRITPSGLGVSAKKRFTDRSRRSIAIDLKANGAVELVLDLVSKSDAVIEGFRPGVMERLGLGPDDCDAVNPKLVFGRVTGWGQTGPLAQTAGHDLNYIALTGGLDAIGRKNSPPTPPLNLVGDYGGGALYLALGVVAALFEAKTSGRGQVIDAAMLDGAASLMTAAFALRGESFSCGERGENLLDGGAPFYDVYETSDGFYVSIAPIEKKFYRELLKQLDISEAEFPHTFSQAEWPEIKIKLSKIFKQHTRGEWIERLGETDCCFAPVMTMEEAPHHPHSVARNTFVNVDGQWQPNIAPRFSRTPTQITGPAPTPGQHSLEILREWGVQIGEIDRLRDAGIIA